ncbi:MAG TPA: acetyl-CoA C-acyltransferase [Bacillales bacterium]|nr:acetyl-CoA C-acyltransferase [Bacillales bacterium]
MHKAVIVRAKRTPIGRKGGLLKNVDVDGLARPVLQHVSAGIEDDVCDVILGNVVGPGGNVARLCALDAGLPLSVTGMTIDRQCSAGLEAIRTACYFVQGGAGECYIAGGVESASRSPFPHRARFAPDALGDPEMGEAAELVAEKYGVSRERQDALALASYERSWRAHEAGVFAEELVPVGLVREDEVFGRKREMRRLVERAKPVFVSGGTVTAANSCGVNDGAGAVVVMSERMAEARGLAPVLRFVDSEVTGVDPRYPGIAPVPAVRRLLARNGLGVNEIDQVELNEAFAAKVAACVQELGLREDRLNVHGGAIAIGHPYGASGAILVTRLYFEALRNPETQYFLAAMGSGGGIGTAVLFEKV